MRPATALRTAGDGDGAPMLSRRHALCCGAALVAGLFTGLASPAAHAAPLTNPCRGALPAELRRHPLLQAALDGIDPTRLVDTHAHLLGTGDSGSGCTVDPRMQQWWHPIESLRRRVILGAACVPRDAESIDRRYVQNLLALAEEFPPGARWWLYAFDSAHDDAGRPQPAWTTFHVPDRYAAAIAAAHPARFQWVASVHPYRADALQALSTAFAGGAVALKWLPSAMNIDLADARCKPFYDLLARHRLPLVVHCGEEQAVPGAGRDAYGNPLLMRHPLAHGVTVIAAHCASLGHALDTDVRSRPKLAAFDLFARLMDEPASQGLLFGDLSAVFQVNRKPEVWRTLLERADWHGRLLHGSDHPLPGVMPLVSWRRLVKAGVLDEADAEPLQRIREHNPLLADLALKRRLRYRGIVLPPAVFEGRALKSASSPAATVATA